jgi:hypothetical protein
MAQKKAPQVKKPVPRGKKPIGLTTAIGPKATTALVICVIAGGLMVAAQQQEDARKNNPPPTAFVEMAPMPGAKRAAAPKNAPAASPSPAASPVVGTVGTPAAAPAAAKGARVTVVGCLEEDGAAFKLTDTTGADAPKARSWKSGFLKKGAAPVKLVGSSNALSLASHLGRRVSVTGTLANREMHAHAMHRVSGSCKAN